MAILDEIQRLVPGMTFALIYWLGKISIPRCLLEFPARRRIRN